MLAGLLGAFIPQIVSTFVDKIAGAFTAYQQGKITREQLHAEVTKALLASLAEIEKAHADAIAKTFASFMQTMEKSPLMKAVWATVVLSQLFVLLWHQWVIPFIIAMGWIAKYPSSGTTVDWSYALVAFCLGAGSVILRTGPAAGYVDKLKNLVVR